ncbi:tripartite tricarboxylate transporter TctB family protein [Roseibium sp. SCP14]|uniref:tripartite tricarboxylate transporter TctB family protein n=1 Tax=Roseibium sp. SCP14 TaxID=3141375 RepID=UPI00333B4C41
MKQPASRNAWADRLSGWIFIVLGLLVVAASLAMPDYTELGSHWYEAPGLTPGILGMALAGSGALLAFRKTDALLGEADMLAILTNARSRKRIFWAMALCVTYAIVLVGVIPFWLASGLFVFTFILGFEHFPDPEPAKLPGRLLASALIAIGASAAITLLFQELFLVRLP